MTKRRPKKRNPNARRSRSKKIICNYCGEEYSESSIAAHYAIRHPINTNSKPLRRDHMDEYILCYRLKTHNSENDVENLREELLEEMKVHLEEGEELEIVDFDEVQLVPKNTESAS